jgi:hypothetical protein
LTVKENHRLCLRIYDRSATVFAVRLTGDLSGYPTGFLW